MGGVTLNRLCVLLSPTTAVNRWKQQSRTFKGASETPMHDTSWQFRHGPSPHPSTQMTGLREGGRHPHELTIRAHSALWPLEQRCKSNYIHHTRPYAHRDRELHKQALEVPPPPSTEAHTQPPLVSPSTSKFGVTQWQTNEQLISHAHLHTATPASAACLHYPAIEI